MIDLTNTIRRQLTLFVNKPDAEQIERIRNRYNPLQQELIDAHVTLCREDELVDIDLVLDNLKNLRHKTITLFFEKPIRFDNDKGVLLPASGANEAFYQLRKQVLQGLADDPRQHEPHITLMHPRNATCTDEIFKAIEMVTLPKQLSFRAISLIEQTDGKPWVTLKVFTLID